VIVVIGDPDLRPSLGDVSAVAGGPAAAIARACVMAGSTVQLAGKIGDDPAGDEILLFLNRDGIGHVALLRDAGHPTRIAPPGSAAATGPDQDDASVEAAWSLDTEADQADPAASAGGAASAEPTSSALAPEDLDLALRYLVTFAVLVVAEPLGAATLAVAAEAAAFSGAHLVIVGQPAEVPRVPADGITILEPPPVDPDGDFAGLVARYAVSLDGGSPAAAAFRAALGDTGWEPAVS